VYYKLSVINIATIVMCFMYTTEDNHWSHDTMEKQNWEKCSTLTW